MAGHELDAPPWSRVEGTLISTARAVRRAYERALVDVELNLAEASVLAHLGTVDQLTQVELARRLGTGRARIGVHIDALVGKSAVRRDADPTDRRVWLVSLTDEGRELWRRSVEVDRRIRRSLRQGLSAADRAHLDDMLLQIHRNAALLEIALD